MVKKLYTRVLGRMEFVADLALRDSKVGAEIGVWTGEFSKELLMIIPGLKLYLVDPWKQLHNIRSRTVAEMSDEAFEYMYQMVNAATKGYNVEILRMTGEKALDCIPDNSLDFVYLDAIHDYEWVKLAIKAWSEKVKLGGVISGHDYDFQHPGTVMAVNESCLGNLDIYEPAKIWAYIKNSVS